MKDSIWMQNAALPTFPQLEGDLRTDVLVIGGGLAGLLCARKMAEEGVDVALIEADRVFRGISRNTTAKITSQHGLVYDRLSREFDPDTARLYWEANEKALAEYRKYAEKIDCDFEVRDHFVYSVHSRERLEREMAALERMRIPAEFTERLPLPVGTVGAVRFLNQAQFNPVKFASGLCGDLLIYEKTAAKVFLGNRVVTDRGAITASKIIVATHFPIWNKHGGYFLKMYQSRSYVLALENGPDLNGMYLDESGTGVSFRNYGNQLLLGGGAHRTGKKGTAWAELERLAMLHYPDSREICRWAAQDCITLDGVPYIGPYSKATPDLYVATGFNKWGMTSSMVSAMVLADLVLGRENPYEKVFDPSRSSMRLQLLANGAEAAFNLLTPTRPRCPHLGCALKWNRQEHSWDCPCHGSRFTEQGKLLDNPATGDLKRD